MRSAQGDTLIQAREVEEGEGGEGLEEAGGVGKLACGDEALGGGIDLEVEAGEVVVGDGVAVDLDALVNAREMGRRVKGGAVAGGSEDAGEGGGRGALAVGSGDQDRGKAVLGVAEGAGQDAHVLEIELGAWNIRRGNELETTGVKVIDRCGIGHEGILGGRDGWGR